MEQTEQPVRGGRYNKVIFMPTIAKTKRYRELTYRHLRLIQLFGVVSELRLHTNKAVNPDAAKYYNNKLYVWDDYGSFFAASTQSMMQVFYIELDGFIGAFWNKNARRVQLRNNEHGSLAAYLYDGTRTDRKKSAKLVFEALLQSRANELNMIHDTRGKLAHFKKLDMRNSALVPGDKETRKILNELARILHLLGFQKWNKPHLIERDGDAATSTQAVINKLVSDDNKAVAMRKKYLDERNKWFSC